MKRILLLCCVGMCLSVNAETRTIKETFDDNGNSMQWSEYSTRKNSAVIRDGYYVIERKGGLFVTPQTQVPVGKLPIDVERNFKVSFKLLIPKFNSGFTIATNNGTFLFTAKRLYPIVTTWEDLEQGKQPVLDAKNYLPMPSKKGKKNVEMVISIEKKGKTTNLYVDDMEVYSTTDMGFKTNSFVLNLVAGVLKVDEIIVEQQVEDEGW